MNVLDIVCITIIVVAAIRCAFRGFIREVMSMAALIFGIVAAVFFSKAGAIIIDTYVGYSNWNQIIAFLVIFLVVYLVVKLLEGLLHRLFERIHLERLDRSLGFFLGLAEGAIVVILVVYLLKVQPLFDVSSVLDSSFVAGIVLDIVPIVAPAAAESVSGNV